jgi:hypothetical protein
VARRAAAAENAAHDEAALKSAIVVAASELARDPAHRDLQFATGSETVSIGGSNLRVDVGWEGDKLDVNAASLADIELALQDQHISASEIAAALNLVAASRAAQKPIALLDDIASRTATAECFYRALTVFGGRAALGDEPGAGQQPIGQPAPGSRLAVHAELTSARGGLSAVLLMTGDPKSPVRTLDWRHTRKAAGSACHAS